MLLCNPHNPIMDHWEREDLETVARLAEKHGVLVFCDEIFAEHVCGGTLVPYAEVGGDNCIIATSLGKAFNFTGSSHANVIIPGKLVREKYIEQRNYDHYGSIDPFIYTATLAAYTPGGKDWIDALLSYSGENIRLLSDFFAEYLPRVRPCRHRAGTLVWVYFNGLGLGESALWDFFENEAAFTGDRGSIYGLGGGGFVRFQMGTPRSILLKALDRFRAAAEKRGWLA
jgi:cystathionine beta-lyase